MNQSLSEGILREVVRCAGNSNPCKFDPVSWQIQKLSAKDRLRSWVEQKAAARNFFRFNPEVVLCALDKLSNSLPEMEWFHSRLADEWSRAILARILVYRMLGPKKVRMPLDHAEFWRQIEQLEELADRTQTVDAGFRGWQLPRLDLNPLGIPVVLHAVPAGVQIIFVEEQYAYRHSDVKVETRKGDVVLDLGGCWGDTGLYFAHKTGPLGKVYTFEFMPHNLLILKKNLELNAEFRKSIEVIESPVWDKSGEVLTFQVDGPASRISEGSGDGGNVVQAGTVALDDFVRERRLEKVDFIKMDIEGAELAALRGAESTIRRFEPTLAIAVYHSLHDLVSIPRWVDSLNLGYRLHLGHYSINEWETVLFCQPRREWS